MIDDLVTWLTDPEHWTGPDGVPEDETRPERP